MCAYIYIFFPQTKKLEICGSLNPDCLLTRPGEQAKVVFRDSWLFLYLGEDPGDAFLLGRWA